MRKTTAEIVREYGPFEGGGNVGGVTYDGTVVWYAAGDRLNALDPGSGEIVRSIEKSSSVELVVGSLILVVAFTLSLLLITFELLYYL